MPQNTLEALFEDEIQDLYSAEKQLTKALPKLVEKITSPALKNVVQMHLHETQNQMTRIEQCCRELGIEPDGRSCKAMKGLIDETEETVGEFEESLVRDAAIIGCAQKVEHYEICGYGTLIAHANLLGYESAASILQQTLAEEYGADSKLNELAMNELNNQALVEGGSAVHRSGRAEMF